MSKKEVRVVHVSGKRKKAIARATIKPGEGVVKINSVPLSVYGNECLRMRVQEPLLIAGELIKKVNINVRVTGGGYQSQNEAIRLSIAKGLVEYFNNDSLKRKYLVYDKHLLIADDRQTEPQKPCRSSARRGKQTSKR